MEIDGFVWTEIELRCDLESPVSAVVWNIAIRSAKALLSFDMVEGGRSAVGSLWAVEDLQALLLSPFCRAAIRAATDIGADTVLPLSTTMMMRSIGERWHASAIYFFRLYLFPVGYDVQLDFVSSDYQSEIFLKGID